LLEMEYALCDWMQILEIDCDSRELNTNNGLQERGVLKNSVQNHVVFSLQSSAN